MAKFNNFFALTLILILHNTLVFQTISCAQKSSVNKLNQEFLVGKWEQINKYGIQTGYIFNKDGTCSLYFNDVLLNDISLDSIIIKTFYELDTSTCPTQITLFNKCIAGCGTTNNIKPDTISKGIIEIVSQDKILMNFTKHSMIEPINRPVDFFDRLGNINAYIRQKKNGN
jgi:hypothetical protein